MAKENDTDRMLDELVKGKNPEELLGKDGVLKQLTKRFVERALEGEMTTHLGYEKNASEGKNTGNSRNGKTSKQVKADFGEVEIEVPRDRNGEFEPQLVKKRQRRLPGFDDKVIALYARGMTTREIQGHLYELYGVEVSPTLISNVTDSVTCPKEFLVAFSCKGRGLCPSCGAKRAAIFSELLHNQILADVPHAQWVFSIPKMLRPYFLHHRELLGEMARLAYETVREMMAAAVDEPHARPGMVGVIQTFSSSLKWNPHIHAIASRGVWTPDGEWMPVPYVDEHRAELLFRHKLLALLRDRGLISQDRIDLLLSWSHSGFSIHNRTTVFPSDTEGLHPGRRSLGEGGKLACYLMRAPVNLSRLRFDKDSGLLVYLPKPGHELDEDALTDPLEFLARVLIHVPEPNKHLVHFYGAYANRIRQSYREPIRPDDEAKTLSRRAANKRWAELIYRIYHVDPLTCTQCGGEMKILAFITDPAVIRTILDHRDKTPAQPRAPPVESSV